MTKQEYIRYWVETSEKDWEAAENLFEKKNYVHSLFFAHLALEKICKAHWVKDNKTDHPPRIHNLVYLLSQTSVKLNNEQLDFLNLFNDFQLEGRYPDYQQKIYKYCNREVTDEQL